MRNLNIQKTNTPNSLSRWYKIKSPLRVIYNFLIIYTSKYCPSLALKRVLLRTTGIKIGKDTSIGLGATFDIFFPELIEIGTNCIIGYNTTIIAHEFLIEEYRTGRIKIGNNVMIGANTTILPGITIGDNAKISAMTLVNKDIEKNTFSGGIPSKTLKNTSK